MKPLSSRLRNTFAFVSVVLFVIACLLPAYSDGTSGLLCLLAGWCTVSHAKWLMFLAWVANIPAIVGWFVYAFGKKGDMRIVLLLASSAVILSLGMFDVNEMHDEYVRQIRPASGAYVWMASFVVLLIGALVVGRKSADV